MNHAVTRHKMFCLTGLLLAGLTTSPTLAHPQNGGHCANRGMNSPVRTMSCPRGNSAQAVARPTHTSTGTPIRWVNVPVPNYASGGGYGGYGYGYGGYGYGGYGYGGYGYGGYGFGSSGMSYSAAPSTVRRRSTRKAARRATVAPDPGSARNYMFHKGVAEFTRKNSLGGKIYLADGGDKWLLQFNGAPVYSSQGVKIPCLGRQRGQDQDQSVLLILTFQGENVAAAKVEPNYLGAR